MMAYLVRLAAVLLLTACAWPFELDAWTHGSATSGATIILVNGSGTPLDNGSGVELSAQ